MMQAPAPRPQEIQTLVDMFDRRQFLGAETLARAMIMRFPRHDLGWKALGTSLKLQGRHAESLTALLAAEKMAPGDADLAYNLGNAYLDNGRLDDAVSSFRRTVALIPGFLPAHFGLGHVLHMQARFDDAIVSYRAVLEIDPNVAEAHNNLGVTLMEQRRAAEAEPCFREALRCRHQFAEAHANLGNALREQGHLEQACVAWEQAISLKPDYVEPHYFLSTVKTYRAGDPHLAMLEPVLERVGFLPMETRIRFWFALGKIREDLGLFDAAFAAYHEGNRLQHQQLGVNEDAEDAMIERIIAVFTPAFFARHARPQGSGRQAIFIVGMPRSGTSLLEQILSTCPGVHGAGEVVDLPEVVKEAMPQADFANFPEALLDMPADELQHIGAHYLQRLLRHEPGAARITDKMLSNFLFLGLIHLMLPDAKIIHAMRDPMDCCFSSYTYLFDSDNLKFTYDLGSLGRCYVRYRKLMQHWQTVLPPGTFLDLHYEELVADVEGQARRLLHYLELPWDARCLEFHQNTRRVKTVSAAQVRKPIYQTSLARWKRFESHLAPLHDMVKVYQR